jgi:RNA polymerase sigma-70 factor (ECF subfamily)
LKEQGESTISKHDSLLQKAQDLDPDALGQIFDNHYEQIYSYVLRRIGKEDLAQNIASETFCRLLESYHKGKGPADGVLYWMYRVAHNLVVDVYRQSDRQPLPLYEEVLSDKGLEPEEAVLQQQRQNRVRWALAQLTEDQQQVLSLKFFEGMDNGQVAAIMQKTVGSVKSLQHRGLSSLERFLEQASQQHSLGDLPAAWDSGIE